MPTVRTISDAGKSADASALNVGAAALPDDGPPNTRFAACVLSDIAKVPLVVMGEPVTVCLAGTVSATLVTVPLVPFAAAVMRPFESTVRFVFV